jgi:starvation-inducible DNA-binding protein
MDTQARQTAALDTPSGHSPQAVRDTPPTLTARLADVFTWHVKTKSFCWHRSGAHFRVDHGLLDEQATEVYEITDAIAERTHTRGGTTLRSIGHSATLKRLRGNDATFVTPHEMLSKLRDDDKQVASTMRQLRGLCAEHGDVAPARLAGVSIDEAERRVWFLFEATRRAE